MDLQTRKLEFIKDFLELNSEEAVIQLERLLKKQISVDVEPDHTPMSVEEFNARVDQSMSDSINGRLTTSKSFKSEINKWT